MSGVLSVYVKQREYSGFPFTPPSSAFILHINKTHSWELHTNIPTKGPSNKQPKRKSEFTINQMFSSISSSLIPLLLAFHCWIKRKYKWPKLPCKSNPCSSVILGFCDWKRSHESHLVLVPLEALFSGNLCCVSWHHCYSQDIIYL